MYYFSSPLWKTQHSHNNRHSHYFPNPPLVMYGKLLQLQRRLGGPEKFPLIKQSCYADTAAAAFPPGIFAAFLLSHATDYRTGIYTYSNHAPSLRNLLPDLPCVVKISTASAGTCFALLLWRFLSLSLHCWLHFRLLLLCGIGIEWIILLRLFTHEKHLLKLNSFHNCVAIGLLFMYPNFRFVWNISVSA